MDVDDRTDRFAMNRNASIVLSIGILLAGLAGAWSFRKPAEQAAAPVSQPLFPVASTILTEAEPLPDTTAPVQWNGPKPASSSAPIRLPYVVTRKGPTPEAASPLDKPEQPPTLPEEFDPALTVHRTSAPPAAASTSPANDIAAEEPQGPRMHRIRDGDTLPSLAERYLGSAALAHELYEANLDVLTNPQLLPIGKEIRLPRHVSETATSGARPDGRAVYDRPAYDRPAYGQPDNSGPRPTNGNPHVTPRAPIGLIR